MGTKHVELPHAVHKRMLGTHKEGLLENMGLDEACLPAYRKRRRK